ncbi:DUF2442 domain-containing protein [Pseudomonas sp. C11]|uniref:DUF2442 domain-containing protein n=1 Tax=Pseudomonas sp. C11 TaxID=3075550 RepID=UPI002AFF25C0|nr:DUF2442 domain-containing protein [Pseudomonas sp. C11]
MRIPQFTIRSVIPVTPYVLQLTFADGKSYSVDLEEVLRSHPTLFPLLNPEIFAKVEVGDWGASILWDNNDEFELAADNLRARALEQAGECSHEKLQRWMASNNLTLDAAAQALGISRRMLAYYRSGEKDIPRTVALAMIGWDHSMKNIEDHYHIAETMTEISLRLRHDIHVASSQHEYLIEAYSKEFVGYELEHLDAPLIIPAYHYEYDQYSNLANDEFSIISDWEEEKRKA